MVPFERKRSYQLSRKSCTPITRSPCILPIPHARLWTSEGFTVSWWLQAKGSQNHKSTSQIIDEDTRSSNDIYLVRLYNLNFTYKGTKRIYF